ncbi:MAG: 4-(cytidine 5'-diphospho)-2-C-methyl-D-erythritol kinase [Ignavibacteria bacterium]|nr:4-(cytidine 5'-diphospho)-2-C-methyl-D-erythritol kinase [Ignavibacteria bacterium]
MKKITIKSHAKINLGLHVVRKREDGFHDIETIFYPVGLHDTITFEKSEVYKLETNIADFTADPSSNLVTKAVKILERESGTLLPVHINLEKHIPMGAGLGGGSSNAAVTLLSLNEIYSLGFSNSQLHKFALELGSDVPYFLRLKPAYAVSRGEVLTYLDIDIPLHCLLVNPGIHVATKWAYANVTPSQPRKSLKECVTERGIDLKSEAQWLTNDFENPVFTAYPEIAELKHRLLEAGAEFALMSGSGSTMYGFFKDAMTMDTIAGELGAKFFVYQSVYED